MDLSIKKIDRERKRQSSKSFSDRLQRVTPLAAVTTVNQISRLEERYTAKLSATGETLQCSTMTVYLEDTFKVLHDFHFDLETFEIPTSILEETTCTTPGCSTLKVLVPDLIMGVAFGASEKFPGFFIAGPWKA